MRNRYLVCYDIADPKRLRRIFKTLEGYGDHLQYSVFSCDLSRKEKALLLDALLGHFNRKEDSLLMIDLGPANGDARERFTFFGQGLRPVEEDTFII